MTLFTVKKNPACGILRRYAGPFLKAKEILSIEPLAIQEGKARRRAHLDQAIGADADDEMRTTHQMTLEGAAAHLKLFREIIRVMAKQN